MRTKIFAYKGVIGAETDIKDGKFINDPMAKGQLGCVISTSEIDITKEAKEILKKAPREGGSFAPIMLTKHENSTISEYGKSSIALFGFWKHIFEGEDICIGRTCDREVLNDCNETDIEIPEEFKKLIDNDL